MIWLALLQYWKFAVMAALGLFIGWQQLQIAHRDARIAGLEADLVVQAEEVRRANDAVAKVKTANDVTVQSHDRAKADYDETVRALERELARLGDEKQKVQIVRKVIREQAAKCDGVVPPGIGAAIDWLRVNPDQQGGGGRDGDPVRAPGHPGVAPGLPR